MPDATKPVKRIKNKEGNLREKKDGYKNYGSPHKTTGGTGSLF
jgi:hypothetical protein